MVPRAYETALSTESGDLGVRILSLPEYLRPYLEAHGPLEDVASNLGIELQDRIGATDLQRMLRAMADEVTPFRPPTQRPRGELQELISDVIFEPVVVVEESPGVTRALGTLVSQAGAAYVGTEYDSLFLLVAYETTLIVAWFVSGPAIGFREAAQEAAHTVGRPYFEALFATLIERLRGRPSRREQRRRARYDLEDSEGA
jgi:hypothetical protein